MPFDSCGRAHGKGCHRSRIISLFWQVAGTLLIGVAVLFSLATDVKNNSGNGLKTIEWSKRQPSRR